MKKILLFILLCAIGLKAQYKEVLFDTDTPVLRLQIQQSTPTAQSYTMAGTAGTKSYVSWGDGTVELISWTGADQTISHTPSVSGYLWVRFNNPQNITKFRYETEQKLYFSLSWFTVCKNLTYFYQANVVTTSITGNLSSIPNATYVDISGSNTVTGNLSSIPNATIVGIAGSNTVTGNLSSIPNATIVGIGGSNTVTGNLSSIPNATTVSIWGSNTVTGDLSSISKATYVSIWGSNTVAEYTSPVSWSNSMNYFAVVPIASGGLDATEIDNLIIDLDGSTWAGSNKTLILTGTNAAPTAAANDALTSLALKGVSVSTN